MSELHIDTTVYEGRPADETGRLPKEIHTYDLLDRLSIPFVRVDHEAAMTIEARATLAMHTRRRAIKVSARVSPFFERGGWLIALLLS